MSDDPVSPAEYRALARFRRALRMFLHFSETAVRSAGMTPAQHQLMLAVKGWEGARPPSIGDLADALLLRHHSTVEVVARAVEAGLLVRQADQHDARRQQVALTPLGEEKLARLSALHREELQRFHEAALGELLVLGQGRTS